VRHKEQIHDGQHQAIILQEVWDKVQASLRAGSPLQPGQVSVRRTNILKGKIFDPDNVPYTPTYTKKGARQYCYYLSQNLLQYRNHPKGLIARIPASKIPCN